MQLFKKEIYGNFWFFITLPNFYRRTKFENSWKIDYHGLKTISYTTLILFLETQERTCSLSEFLISSINRRVIGVKNFTLRIKFECEVVTKTLYDATGMRTDLQVRTAFSRRKLGPRPG